MGLERTLSNVHFFHFFHLFYRLLRIFTFRLHVQGRRRRRTVPTSHTTTRSIMYVFFSYCLFFSFTNGFLHLDNIYRDYDYYERLPSHTHNPFSGQLPCDAMATTIINASTILPPPVHQHVRDYDNDQRPSSHT